MSPRLPRRAQAVHQQPEIDSRWAPKTIRLDFIETVGVLSLMQLLTMAPFALRSTMYEPQMAGRVGAELYLAGAILGIVLLLFLPVFLIGVSAVRGSRWLLAAFLFLVHVALVGASFFYAKFGTYPLPVLLRDFVDAPEAFIAYTQSGTSLGELALSCVVIALLMASSILIGFRTVPRARTSLASFIAGVLILVILRVPLISTQRGQHEFVYTQHSLPAIKYLFDVVYSTRANNIEAARNIVPPIAATLAPPSLRAKNVVLIIAECLRADHFSHYGYERDTSPFLTLDREHWIVFDHAYAQASRTADTFPVIFNSRYFAGIDRTNDGASIMWNALRKAGVQSAFLSAGAMEWGGITHAIDFARIDHTLIASDAAQSSTRTAEQFSYAIDDESVVQRFVQLLSNQLKDTPSFTTLHFVGSHYPFVYEDREDFFRPVITDTEYERTDESVAVQQYETTESIRLGTIKRLINSYDNSVRHVDRMVHQILGALEASGQLNDSVVILTSDHGESLGEHGTLYHGTTLYDEQVHIPMLIRVGANLSGLRETLEARRDGVASHIDLMPTIHDLLVSQNIPSLFQGGSWLRTQKPYELLLFRGIGERMAVVTPTRKYMLDVKSEQAEEYDLQHDPGETSNVWPQGRVEARAFLERALRAARAE